MKASLIRSKASAVIALRAHALRQTLTVSERKLFRAINAGKLRVQFRRQVPLGRYIVDFLAPAARLIVEVDGGYHCRRRAADARRDGVLRRSGYRVLRLDADLVARNLPEAVSRIRAALAQAP